MIDKITGDRYYHIYNQANGMVNIFKEAKNYPFFLKKVKKHLSPVCDVLSYCLMKNHFHLVIKTKNLPDEIISRALANLFISYSKAFNKTYNRSGSLFKKPFKRKLIEHEKYLINVIVYIHRNPVKDGFVEQVVEYPWSSYQEIIDDADTFLDKKYILTLFGNVENFKSTVNSINQPSFVPTFTHD